MSYYDKVIAFFFFLRHYADTPYKSNEYTTMKVGVIFEEKYYYCNKFNFNNIRVCYFS